MFKMVLEKAEESETKLPTSSGSWKSKRVSEKHLLQFYWLGQSLWLCGSQQTVEHLKRWEYQTIWPASWEICMQVNMQVRTGHGTTDWFHIGKRVHEGCILSPCLFNLYAEYSMWNAGLDEEQKNKWLQTLLNVPQDQNCSWVRAADCSQDLKDEGPIKRGLHWGSLRP